MSTEISAETTPEEVQPEKVESGEVDIADAIFEDAAKESEVADDGAEVANDAVNTSKTKTEDVEDEFSALKADSDIPEAEFEGEVEGVKLKLPPGLKPDNPELLDFTKMVKESGMKQEAAQKFLDLYLGKQKSLINQMVEADTKFRADLDRKWNAEIKSDPEFGGKNFNASNNYIQNFMRKFATKEELLWTMEKDGKIGLLQLYKDGNLKNNPVLFRMLARAGKAFSEAQPVTTDAKPARNKEISLEDAIFGDHK